MTNLLLHFELYVMYVMYVMYVILCVIIYNKSQYKIEYPNNM